METGHLFMIQKKKEKKTSNLELLNPENCHLSIQFSLDGFSFCVLNKDAKKFVALYSFTFKESNNTPIKLLENITSVFKNEELLQDNYHSANVCHISDLSTFVPKALFNEENIKDYLKFTNKIFPSDFAVYDEIGSHDLVNIFIPYVNINNFLLDRFGGFEYKHYSTLLVESLMNIYKLSLVPHMFVHISGKHFEIIVIANKKLQIYNTFTYTSKEDFIYYILFTAEQLKLNPEKFELVLLGAVDKKDELYTIAYKYIRNVSLLENRSKYGFDPIFTENDKRAYYTLFNQY